MATALEPTRPWWMLPPRRIRWGWWIALAPVLLWLEYITGAYAQFPVVYVIPVTLAAWYAGRWPALTLAVCMPVAQVAFALLDPTQKISLPALVAATVFRGAVVVFMALWCARLSEYERALTREVQTLQGLLSICSFCKKIRNESGEWEHLERFISRRSDTRFSHGLCQTCQETHYGGLGDPTAEATGG